MPSYSTPEAVAGFLKDFQMRINHQKKGTFSPAHVRYFLTISRYGKEFSTSFESNPAVYGGRPSRRSSLPSQAMPSPCEATVLTSSWMSSAKG